MLEAEKHYQCSYSILVFLITSRIVIHVPPTSHHMICNLILMKINNTQNKTRNPNIYT